MRGFLSKSKIGTVQINELKQALELGSKVHFLNCVALEQLLRLRLSELTQAIAMLADDPTVDVAPQKGKPQQEALAAADVAACVLDDSIASDSRIVFDDEMAASLLMGLFAEEPIDGPVDSTVLVEKGDGGEVEQNHLFALRFGRRLDSKLEAHAVLCEASIYALLGVITSHWWQHARHEW
jgi:hypothetical protein